MRPPVNGNEEGEIGRITITKKTRRCELEEKTKGYNTKTD